MNKKTKQNSKAFIFSNPNHKDMDGAVQLLRITISDQGTKIDFGYQAGEFDAGEWIHIKPETFIRCKEMGESIAESFKPKKIQAKYFLIKATNIPFGPAKHHFNSSIEWRYFSLYFPRLPEGTRSFDLIEKEFGDKNEFNFYNIRLDEEEKMSMIY